MKRTKSLIGIFWIYHNAVIGRAISPEDGDETMEGWVDSPDSHIQLWENTPGFLKGYPELKESEYQSLPRGRVLFNRKTGCSIIYLDRLLMGKKFQKRISAFFQLSPTKVEWSADPHYVTGNNL
jgi:hypothetical protein